MNIVRRGRLLTLGVVMLVVIFGGSASAGAVSLEKFFPDMAKQAQAKLTADEIAVLLKYLTDSQRQNLLQGQESFSKFVEQENQRRSLLQAALVSGMEKDPTRSLLLERQLEQLLINQYVQMHQGFKLNKDYPSVDDARAYYEKNKDKYVLEERIHVWQIFMPAPADKNEKDFAAIEADAKEVVKKIKRGKMEFSAAADAYSKHEASRLNGGYMGLIKISSLVPEIRAEIDNLKPETPSDPIKTADGIHIVKIGARVAAQPVAFEQVEKSILQLLRNESLAKVRQEILDQTIKSYPPGTYSDKELSDLYNKVKQAYQ